MKDIELICLELVQRGVLEVDHVDDTGELSFVVRGSDYEHR